MKSLLFVLALLAASESQAALIQRLTTVNCASAVSDAQVYMTFDSSISPFAPNSLRVRGEDVSINGLLLTSGEEGSTYSGRLVAGEEFSFTLPHDDRNNFDFNGAVTVDGTRKGMFCRVTTRFRIF